MPALARHLQEEFDRLCPDGWGCEREAKVIPKDLAQVLGYTPQADVLFQEEASGRLFQVVRSLATRLEEMTDVPLQSEQGAVWGMPEALGG